MRSTTRDAHAVPMPVGDGTVVEGLRTGIAAAGLDCGCQDAANDMLDRVDRDDRLARRTSGLADARKMRDAIVLVLALLEELDDLMPDEPDRSALHEIAGLFRDVADFATHGAASVILAAGKGTA